MSMQLDFTPHSWYMGAAIEKTGIHHNDIRDWPWNAYIEDGMITYSVIELHATTLAELKQKIKAYRSK